MGIPIAVVCFYVMSDLKHFCGDDTEQISACYSYQGWEVHALCNWKEYLLQNLNSSLKRAHSMLSWVFYFVLSSVLNVGMKNTYIREYIVRSGTGNSQVKKNRVIVDFRYTCTSELGESPFAHDIHKMIERNDKLWECCQRSVNGCCATIVFLVERWCDSIK